MVKSTEEILLDICDKLEKNISSMHNRVKKTRDKILSEDIIKENNIDLRKKYLEDAKTLRKLINVRYNRSNINRLNPVVVGPSIMGTFRRGLVKIEEYDKEIKIIIDGMKKIVDQEDEAKRKKIADKTLGKIFVMRI